MNRRSFLSYLPFAFPASVAAAVREEEGPKPIAGVGVLRMPVKIGTEVRELTRKFSEQCKAGTTICLPNRRDDTGAYEWDFRVEGGDPKQVRVERGS
jgi:hypothetical protein